MGRPRRYTPDQEAKISALVAEHGPREAARRWKGPTLDPATATRIHAQHGGTTTNPVKLAEAAAAAAQPTATPSPPTPGAPVDLVVIQEAAVRRLSDALAACPASQPKVIGQLSRDLGAAAKALEAARAAARPPEEKRWRVALFLPERVL